NQHKHIMFAIVPRGHIYDLDFVSNFQWRGRALSDTASFERKLQGIIEMVVPSHCSFFRVVCVDDDLHVDTLFTFIIFGWASHIYPPMSSLTILTWVSVSSISRSALFLYLVGLPERGCG